MIKTLIENYGEIGWAGVVIIAMVWYFWYQTKRQTKREDKREERDAKREEKILHIIDVSLKDMEKTVRKDSENTEKVENTISGLKNAIENHLVHSIKRLTAEILKLNKK